MTLAAARRGPLLEVVPDQPGSLEGDAELELEGSTSGPITHIQTFDEIVETAIKSCSLEDRRGAIKMIVLIGAKQDISLEPRLLLRARDVLRDIITGDSLDLSDPAMARATMLAAVDMVMEKMGEQAESFLRECADAMEGRVELTYAVREELLAKLEMENDRTGGVKNRIDDWKDLIKEMEAELKNQPINDFGSIIDPSDTEAQTIINKELQDQAMNLMNEFAELAKYDFESDSELIRDEATQKMLGILVKLATIYSKLPSVKGFLNAVITDGEKAKKFRPFVEATKEALGR